jgi:hypothetical protein
VSSYAEVTVIVDGALDESATFTDETALAEFLASQHTAAQADGLPTEVYVLWHDHAMSDQECCCVQYVSDHHPDYSWNMEAGS